MKHFVLSAYFVGLTVVGFDALWGQMLRNGAARTLADIRASGMLPGGNRVRTEYTGLPILDKSLVGPVIFYDILMYQQNTVQRGILVSVFSTMQAASFAMLVSLRDTRRRKWLSILEYVAWGVFNQAFGAAVGYPLYCLIQVQRHARHSGSKPMEDHEDTLTYVLTSLFAALMPAWLLYPAFEDCSSATRQLLIASYRASPVVFAMVKPILSKLHGRKPGIGAHGSTNTGIKISLRISAIFAAVCHLYVILQSQRTGLETLWAVFWPGSTRVESHQPDFLPHACHRFLQNDLIVIGLALVPYSTFIIGDWVGGQSWKTWAKQLSILAMTSVLASPGAVFTWILAEVL